MFGDGFCGYYTIISQYFSDRHGGDTLEPGINNAQVMQNAKNDVLHLKEIVVKP
jgi:hypothetical protein